MANNDMYKAEIQVVPERLKLCDRTDFDNLPIAANRTVLEYEGEDEPDSVRNSLYLIFGKYMGIHETEVRAKLFNYGTENSDYIEGVSERYLKRKHMTVNSWLTSVKNKEKGDLLALFTLCVMCNVHAVVWFKDTYWCTFVHDSTWKLSELMTASDICLLYKGSDVYQEAIPKNRRLDQLRVKRARERMEETGELSEELSRQLHGSSKASKNVKTDTAHHAPEEAGRSKGFRNINKPVTAVHSGPETRVTRKMVLDAKRSQARMMTRQSKRLVNKVRDDPNLISPPAKKVEDPKPRTIDTQGKPGSFKLKTVGIMKPKKPPHRVTCRLCNEVCDSTAAYTIHFREKHGDISKCTICGKIFVNPTTLRRHMYSHQDIQYDCPDCGKRFSFKADLKTHRDSHSKTPKYTCYMPDCKKSFRHKSNLDNHIKWHTQGRSKNCTVTGCKYTTRDSKLLNAHIASHFKTYKCPICASEFRHREQVKRHLAKDH